MYGAAQTLRRRDFALDEAGRERFVNMIVEESDRLSRIVNEILLARQEAWWLVSQDCLPSFGLGPARPVAMAAVGPLPLAAVPVALPLGAAIVVTVVCFPSAAALLRSTWHVTVDRAPARLAPAGC